MRTCIPPTHARASHASAQVLDWGFTELLPLATLHSTNHGYILADALPFTIQLERLTEGASGSPATPADATSARPSPRRSRPGRR